MRESTLESCCFHPEAVEKARRGLLSEGELSDVADLFKNLGDSSRIKIISALRSGELCVHDLAETAEMSISAVSHQLRILKGARLVAARRSGKMIYYSIDDSHIEILFSVASEHLRERGRR